MLIWFTIVHCLDSTLWVQDYPWGMNFFILDCVFLATYRSRKNGVRNPAPESWILDFRILRFGSRQVLSFSFAHQRQADRGLVDEREFKDLPRISTQDIDVQKCGAIVSKSDNWLLIPNCGNCERLWASKIGFSYSATSNFTLGDCNGRFGLAVFRTAGLHAGNFHVKVLYRVILTYQPKGPEALNPISIS